MKKHYFVNGESFYTLHDAILHGKKSQAFAVYDRLGNLVCAICRANCYNDWPNH